MGIEHRPILMVVWIDAKGKSDLIETLACLYNECHLDHGHMATLSEADATYFLGLMKRYGAIVPNRESGGLLE